MQPCWCGTDPFPPIPHQPQGDPEVSTISGAFNTSDQRRCRLSTSLHTPSLSFLSFLSVTEMMVSVRGDGWIVTTVVTFILCSLVLAGSESIARADPHPVHSIYGHWTASPTFNPRTSQAVVDGPLLGDRHTLFLTLIPSLLPSICSQVAVSDLPSFSCCALWSCAGNGDLGVAVSSPPGSNSVVFSVGMNQVSPLTRRQGGV